MKSDNKTKMQTIGDKRLECDDGGNYVLSVCVNRNTGHHTNQEILLLVWSKGFRYTVPTKSLGTLAHFPIEFYSKQVLQS